MTIIVAVEKDGKFCMASDTLKCGGDTVIPNEESKTIDYVLFDPNSEIVKTVDFPKEIEILGAFAQ